MSVDYNFAVDMFTRYSKHLQGAIESVQTLMSSYDRQLVELKRLADERPSVYLKELERITAKQSEGQKKLEVMIPRMKKMAEQIEEFKTLIVY